MMLIISDDGKLVAESDSGEFWVIFGGFAPIGKKVASEDDVIMETTPGRLYRYLKFHFGFRYWVTCHRDSKIIPSGKTNPSSKCFVVFIYLFFFFNFILMGTMW